MYSAYGENQQGSRAEAGPAITGHDDPTPVEAIRDMAGDQKQQNAGEKLRQSDETKIQRPFRDFIDLPADGDGLHLSGENDKETAQLEKNETRIRESNSSGGVEVLGCSHRILLCHKSLARTRTARERNKDWFRYPKNPLAQWQVPVPESVKVLPASGMNCQS